MSEMWRDKYEKEQQGQKILEHLDVLFEAATLNYTNDDKKMVEWLVGEELEDNGDMVSRIAFANWASKTKFLIEKPLVDADELYKKSIFSNENECVAYTLHVSDILQRNLNFGSVVDKSDGIEYIQIEVYVDGRIAFLYYGYPSYAEDYESITEEEDIDDVGVVMNNLELLGAECTEQGPETHAVLEKFIYDEMGFGYWLDDFKKSLEMNMDDFVRQCSENEH